MNEPTSTWRSSIPTKSEEAAGEPRGSFCGIWCACFGSVEGWMWCRFISLALGNQPCVPHGRNLCGVDLCALEATIDSPGIRKPLQIEAQGGLARWWTRRIIRAASLFLVETQSSVQQAREEQLSRAEWFPNNRPLPPASLPTRTRCKRWAYVGQIRPMKGMEVLKEAASGLPEDVEIDLFGGFWDGMSEDDFEGSRLTYKGGCGARKHDCETHGVRCWFSPRCTTRRGIRG